MLLVTLLAVTFPGVLVAVAMAAVAVAVAVAAAEAAAAVAVAVLCRGDLRTVPVACESLVSAIIILRGRMVIMGLQLVLMLVSWGLLNCGPR